MKHPRIATFYHPRQAYANERSDESRSPQKPALLMSYLKQHGLLETYFDVREFEPFAQDVFHIAHTEDYVSGFFEGQPPHSTGHGTLGITWTPEYAESVRYTNASMYEAIKHSLDHPQEVALSPTSGFHHAMPDSGALFCAFSGQVIASVRLYQERGMSGAWIDLDGHFGNSIEDSRVFVPDLNQAIPQGLNINLKSTHREYVSNFKILLRLVKESFLNHEIDYVVFCHGADSHEDDDLGKQLTTAEWIECSRLFYQWVDDVEREAKRPLPISLSLFGGYRRDDYRSVLALHAADLVECLRILCGHDLDSAPHLSLVTTKTSS